MRSDPIDYELLAPGTLAAVVSLLAQSPGEWLPIAGGTDLMVLYAAGKLPPRKLVSIWNIPELRRIQVVDRELSIGAACTYTDIRQHEIVQREFPLLASAASWTGGIANQNRGTLGGNIVNASPAADSLPALLVYEADLILISARGERRVAYNDFHTGYKQTLLAPDELVGEIRLPRRYLGYTSYSRKVGARRAQAIAKVCLAALARVEQGIIHDIRVAAGSVAPVPLRLKAAEKLATGNRLDSVLLQQAREIAISEIRPIDDIRSTAAYRIAVLGNLVVEFLQRLANPAPMNDGLARWNRLSTDKAVAEILACCGSTAWARKLVERRPFTDADSLIRTSDEVWNKLSPADWNEAFSHHPRIGERQAPGKASAQSATWSREEQKFAAMADHSIEDALAKGNREYESRFGRTFIVCATGKSAPEMLDILHRRLRNDPETELRETAEEQRKITNLRIHKWLAQ
jgi:OHCU decarboxylase